MWKSQVALVSPEPVGSAWGPSGLFPESSPSVPGTFYGPQMAKSVGLSRLCPWLQRADLWSDRVGTERDANVSQDWSQHCHRPPPSTPGPLPAGPTCREGPQPLLFPLLIGFPAVRLHELKKKKVLHFSSLMCLLPSGSFEIHVAQAAASVSVFYLGPGGGGSYLLASGDCAEVASPSQVSAGDPWRRISPPGQTGRLAGGDT